MDWKPLDRCHLEFDSQIDRWDEALPLGNGFCGALIWGPSQGLRFSLDRGDLWDTTPCEAIYREEFSYPNMVRLAREGQEEEIRRIFDAPYNHPLPTKLPAGKLILNFGQGLPQKSKLLLDRAEAVVQIGDILLRAFVHAEEPYGMLSLNCSPEKFELQLENPKFGLDTDGEKDSLVNSSDTASLQTLKYPPVQKCREGKWQWFVQKISNGMEYGVFCLTQQRGSETQIAWCVASSLDGEDWQEQARKNLSQALERGYEYQMQRHVRWWEEYWNCSGLRLPDPFFEKNWYLTQYLLGSCSRKGCYPMPLQGVWTADDGKLPPWKGDYHHDLNTEMSYYPYAKAGHFPEGESFLDYLWNMRECARKFARSFYHAKGLCMPGTMTQNGDPLGGWGMYSLSPTNQLWLCQSFERHWRFTGDRKFLEERAYPYLVETAEFLLSILEEREGFYYLPVSSSPEIHDDTIRAFMTPNTNYDLSLMRYLFTALREMSVCLQDGREAEWSGCLEKLPPLSLTPEKVLMVSSDETLEESHRHFSHAMAIHPLRLIRYDDPTEKEIIDATIHDLERLGTGCWVGFSFTWMAELYAIQRNGNGAAYQLQVFWNNHCSPNGFHLNGDYRKRGTSWFHYRPFTLEANMCAADALQEMLVQTEDGYIRLFPAIPEEWRKKEIGFRNLRGENGLRISSVWKNGLVGLEFYAENATVVHISLENGEEELLKSGCKLENDWAVLELQAGESWHIGLSIDEI